jgi:hypothetical protein
MKMVILFGGGDGGGLVITANGIRRIPPMDPGVMLSAKAAAAMVTAVVKAKSEPTRRSMAKLATSLCNLAVEQVEEVVGPLDADRSLVYLDDDGGFYCGTNGKPPIPLPGPSQSLPLVSDILAAGMVEKDLVELLQQARASKVAVADIFEKPVEVAEKLGLTLSAKSARDLELLAPSNVSSIKDATDREIIGFFHKVAADGRYLETWFNRPYEVSQALKFKLSDSAIERVLNGGASAVFQNSADDGGTAIAVGVVWAGVCIVVGIVFGDTVSRPIEEIVQDRSARAKI